MTVVNALGQGFCHKCKGWLVLTHRHQGYKHLPRGQRPRICAKCAGIIKKETKPFSSVHKQINGQKVRTGEGDYTKDDLARQFTMQGGKCAYCASAIPYSYTIEHIIPIRFEGRNIKSNILLICPECNSSKQHSELTYWLEVKKYRMKPRIYQKVREAYAHHGYEFSGTCRHCIGITQEQHTPFCDTCRPSHHTERTEHHISASHEKRRIAEAHRRGSRNIKTTFY